ncbi:MAG TPA: amino acid adenylation domain-containing protein [Gammaproteobacteria bacterium]
MNMNTNVETRGMPSMTGTADSATRDGNTPIYNESGSTPVDFDPFAAADLEVTAPATESQREIWAAASLGAEASCAYNENICLQLEGELDTGRLANALAELARRHESLRAAFGPDGEALCVTREIPLDLATVDLRAADQDLEALRKQEVETPFDLVNGPLFRCRIVQLSERQHAVLITAHHTICDGWSFGVLLDELARLYNGETLPPAPRFSEHAERQAAIDAKTRERQEAYWKRRLTDAPARLQLPTDHPRPGRRQFHAGFHRHRIPASSMKTLYARGAKRGCTGFTVLAAAVSAYLHRLCGQDDLVIGVPAAGQAEEGLQGLVGHCVSLLPVRSELDANADFDAHLDRFSESLSDAWEHRECSMGRIVRALGLKRDPAVVPLVQLILNIDRRINAPALEGLQSRFEGTPRAYENFEMFLNAINDEEGLLLECTYDASLFSSESIVQRLRELEEFIARLCESEAPIKNLSLIDDTEREQLARWSKGPARDWLASTISELVRAQCARTPDSIAVVDDKAEHDYRALDAQATQIANALRDRGIGRGDIVGVLLARDVHLPAVLLGILETGAAYLPLDADAPADRTRWMLEDANAALVIHDSGAGDNTEINRNDALTAFGGRVVDLAAMQGETVLATHESAIAISTARSPNHSRPTPDDPAYVIYTSGSTGKPKGVVVPHRTVANFLNAMRDVLQPNDDDRFLALTTLSFDIAVLELWLPLVCGARTLIAPREVSRDGVRLCEWIARFDPTVMQATPATWQLLLGAGWEGGRQVRLLSGGEALPIPLARALLSRSREVWNVYGPTETTVWSTLHRVSANDDPVPIGRPLANTQVHVLDASGQPTPPGVPGELYIGGDGVATGYLNRPELTRERFIDDPFSEKENAQLYRTGDRVRFDAEGRLEYLGRLDFQVKLRGYRIEPGEIEAALIAHPSVERAVVAVRDFGTGKTAGDQRLVAWVVMNVNERVRADELREHLSRRLPTYMIPQHVVELDALPLTASGKVDRKQLPSPVASTRNAHVPPATATERRVAAIWQDILGVDEVGRNDDFFDLGGHSLLAARLVMRLREQFDCELAIGAIFDQPVLDGFAKHLTQLKKQQQNEQELFEI